MIDVKREKLIRLADVPTKLHWLADGPNGKAVSLQTLYMWSTRGVRGVRLETLAQGGTRCTTEAALLRFFNKLSPMAGQRDELQATAAAAAAGV